MEEIEKQIRSWEPRRASNGLKSRVFGRRRRKRPVPDVPLAWSWGVPLVAALLWLDLGQAFGRSVGPGARVGRTSVSEAVGLLCRSNAWPLATWQSDHSTVNAVSGRTFASTNLTVSPSTNPPPERAARELTSR